MTTILCIEDETLIRQDIVDELQDAGYRTLQAGNGLDGLTAIKEHKPDLVLCDITIPRMDGYALLTEIRANHPDLDDLPFIYLTALADPADERVGLSHGADDYLTKPIDFERMLARIDAMLRLVGRLRTTKEREQIRLYKAFSDQLEALTGNKETSLYGLQPETPAVAGEALADIGEHLLPPVGQPTRPVEPSAEATKRLAKRDAQNAVGPLLVEEIAVRFQPVWNPKAERVIAYHGSPYQTVAGALSGDAHDRKRPEIDIMVATKIVEHLDRMDERQDNATIIFSVGSETLLGPRRGTFIALLESVAAEQRNRLMIEVVSPTQSDPGDSLTRCLDAATALAGKVLLRAEPKERIATLARSRGVAALSLRYTEDLDDPPGAAADTLSQFAMKANQFGIAPYVFNLDVIGLVKAAAQSGFPLIGGRAVARETEHPGDSFVLQSSRLFFE